MAPDQTLTHKLGGDGPSIPAVGFGLMGISVAYGLPQPDEERLKLLDRAWELGNTNWDTADAYGDSEDLIGKWFALHPERRKDIFLATKFGLKYQGPSEANPMGFVVDSSPEYCRASVERSLKRLGVECIDLYYVHRADPEIPIEKTMEAMKELVREGKIKYIGLSEVSASTLRRAHAIHPVSAVQCEYNPWSLEIEANDLLATCISLGNISVFAYSPLGRGLLTGRFRSKADFEQNEGDMRAAGLSRVEGENFARNLVVVDRLTAMAEKKKKSCSAAQLVLAWLLRQGGEGNVFVIPGTSKVKYMEENFRAAQVEITDEEEKELRRIVGEAGVAGGRDATFGAFVDTKPL